MALRTCPSSHPHFCLPLRSAVSSRKVAYIEIGFTPAMTDTADTANVVVRPPIAWALSVLVGLALQWVVSLPFMPASVPAGWVGGLVFVLALALVAWAITTMT